jgi:AraC-like DNA-binding protein
MKAAGSPERFASDPLGHWVAGRSFIVWCFSRKLGGIAVWGRPVEADVEQIFSLVDAYHRRAPGCDVVTDLSRVEAMSQGAFEVAVLALRERLELYRATPRHAIVRGTGMLAAATEGIFSLLKSGHNVRLFDVTREAFDWVRQPEGTAARAEIVAAVDRATSVPPEVRRLREFLFANLRSARIASAARALGLSERTLHRTLKAARTGFRAELNRVRVDEARRLLAESDEKIDAIARAVGFASHAHLATAFKRLTGETPSSYRARALA